MTGAVEPASRRAMVTAGAATAIGLAMPAVAQSRATLRWRLATSFGRNIPLQYEPARLFADTVRSLTDGAFDIQIFAPGEIVGPFQVLDAVRSNTVEIGQTLGLYYIGQDPSFAFVSGLPFGMTARGHAAWLAHGAGSLVTGFLAGYGVEALYAGNSGAHMAGWFRKEIRSPADLRGLKMRLAGLSGRVFARAGGVPQQIPPGGVYQALERGTIDAAKLATPSDDEVVGLSRIAPFYYYPGWNDPGVATHLLVNQQLWAGLSAANRTALRAGAAVMADAMHTRYDADKPRAIRRLALQGTQFRLLPSDVLETLADAAQAVYAEISADNATFRMLLESYNAYAKDHYLWWQIGEYAVDTAGIRRSRRI